MDLNSLLNPVSPTKERLELPISVANNERTDSDYRWHNNGTKHVTNDTDGQKYRKVYFVCSEKARGCKAKKEVHHLSGGNSITYYEMHDHQPTSPPKLSPIVESKVVAQLEVGAKPSAIHKQIVLESPDLSRKNVPTMNQLYKLKHKILTQHFPTSKLIYKFELTKFR